MLNVYCHSTFLNVWCVQCAHYRMGVSCVLTSVSMNIITPQCAPVLYATAAIAIRFYHYTILSLELMLRNHMGIKMNIAQSQQVPIPIHFQDVLQYCDVSLDSLTGETFFNDSTKQNY